MATVYSVHGRTWVAAATLLVLILIAPNLVQAQQAVTPREYQNTQGAPGAKERVSYGKPTKTWVKDSDGVVHSDGDTNTGNLLIRDAAKRARNNLDDAGLGEVIALCQEGLKNKPTEPNAAYARKLMGWAHNRRGELFADIGSEQQALTEFVASVQNDPTAWRPVHNRGVSYARLGKNKEALDDFNRAIQMHETYPNTWFNRGELKSQMGDLNDALQDYTQAIQLNNREAHYYCSRGACLAKLNRFDDAMRDLDQAVRMDYQDANALVARGEILREQGSYERAANDYRQAMQVNPKYGRGFQAAAWLMATCPDERFRNPKLALSTAKKALELDGDENFKYADTLAAALAANGQFDAAKQILKSAEKKVPKDDLAAYQARLDLYEAGKAYKEQRAGQQPSQTEEALLQRPGFQKQ